MKYTIIIPARGESKRFPKKNIAKLNKIPLIQHTINYALKNKSERIVEVFVNTDDTEIEKIALNCNCSVYIRPKSLGSDTSSTAEVIQEQVRTLECKTDAIILLQATNPLRLDSLILDAISMYEMSGRKSLASYSLLNRKFGKVDSNRFIPENYKFGERMQDLVPRYYENGLIYITNINDALEGKIITDDVYPLIDNHPFASVDIDEPIDLVYADFIMKQIF